MKNQAKAKLFTNGGSQAIRLPKDFAFPNEREVLIKKSGNKLIIEAVNCSWKPFLEACKIFAEVNAKDFKIYRDQLDLNYKEIF